ncbi:hypothetical protein DHEL01_v206247 [Diaporthe helianthi]|uniref:Uncharacterized protein n=1 Tax=Diaporthe helianthi TaxID=158607 RepID=A0A2P5HYN1_DIAHE|nr:hypothetical protein DHEL01_v206247 [Diaporthe helianthi]
MQDLLGSIFLHSQHVDFLVVIYQFGSPLWPAEVRDWWGKIPGLLTGSRRSTCTFLINSDSPAEHLAGIKSHHLNLKETYALNKRVYIETKASQLLDTMYMSPSLSGDFGKEIKEKVMKKATDFEGSLSDISTFLSHSFQASPLTTPAAILRSISQSPAQPTHLHDLQISVLESKEPRVYSWAVATVSWTRLAMRPLRLEELATASAITTSTIDASTGITASDLRHEIPMDMERDIRRNLAGLVSMENRYARMIISPATADIALIGHNHPKLMDDSVLTMACLWYLKTVIGDEDQRESRERQLSPISLIDNAKNTMDPVFEFIDYATHYWPMHFRQVQEPTSILRKAVVDFFRTPKVAEQWFQLYLRCSALPPDLLGAERQASTDGKATEEHKCSPGGRPDSISTAPTSDVTSSERLMPASLGSGPLEGAAEDATPQPSAVEMALLVGLSSIIPDLLPNNSSIESPKDAYIRRGHLDRGTAVLNTGSKYYLESAIASQCDNVPLVVVAL